MTETRPGVILYFTTRTAVSRLSKEQKADLLDAIYVYGEDGEIPNFGNDLVLQVTWDFIKNQIDADYKNYTKKVQSGSYAAYCKKAKKAGKPAVEYDIWVTLDPENRDDLLLTTVNDG